jgi:putative transposase
MNRLSSPVLRMSPVRTCFESPWQNGVAERWVESRRRDLLDHIIVLDERHLKRLLAGYVRYYHEDRTHLGLGKGTPYDRICSVASGRIVSHERLGGLHHRYDRAALSGLSFRPSLYMCRTGTFPAQKNILALQSYSWVEFRLFTLWGGRIAPFSKRIVFWRGTP